MQRGHRTAETRQLVFDLPASFRERAAQLLGHAGEFRDSVTHRPPVEAEPGGEFVPQCGLVQVAGGLGVHVQLPAVESRPTAVRPAGEVCDENVGVQMGITGAAGAMPEGRGEEPAAIGQAMPTRAEPHPTGLALHILERLGHGGVVCSAHCTGAFVIAESEQDRHRLRCVERQIERGDTVLGLGDEPFTRVRVAAVEDHVQVCTVDLAVEAQFLSHRASPAPGRFAGADVVVLTPIGDRLLVVAGVGDGELPDAQHGRFLDCTGLYNRVRTPVQVRTR